MFNCSEPHPHVRLAAIKILSLPVVLALTAAVVLSACRHRDGDNLRQAGDIRIQRLERIIMDTPDDQLQVALTTFGESLASPLLTIVPQDPAFMELVQQYRADETMRDIDATVQQRYSDLGWLERGLTDALQHADDLKAPIALRAAATFIGSSGYADRVRADRESATLAIAIDQYVVPQMERYGFFGDPLYVVHLSDSAYLLVDCLAALVHEYIAMPPEPWTLLDYMVAEGKELYFLDQVLPRTADSVIIRYTAQQMTWMEQHEEQVWAYILQQKLLFSKDYNSFHNMVDEAPKTNAFGNESAPRTTEYIGWKIVEQYMKHSNVSLSELLEETDANKILNASGYHPSSRL